MRKLSQLELQQAVKTLALLVRRGFPLSKAVSSLESSNPTWIEIHSKVKAGDTLGQALKRYPNIFSEHFSAMIMSAEKSPNAESVLTSLSEWLEAADSLRRKILETLHYPLLLLSFLFIETAFILGIGVPALIVPYAFANQTSPPPEIGTLCTLASFFLFFLALASLLGTFRTPWFLPLAMRFSKFKEAVHQADQALWARAVASHLQGGQNLVEALKASAGVVWSKDLRESLAALPARLAQGDHLSQALADSEFIDPQLNWSVTAGETKENLSGTLLYAAEQMESQLMAQSQAFLLFLQPCAMAVVGLMTAAVLGTFWWSFYHFSWGVIP